MSKLMVQIFTSKSHRIKKFRRQKVGRRRMNSSSRMSEKTTYSRALLAALLLLLSSCRLASAADDNMSHYEPVPPVPLLYPHDVSLEITTRANESHALSNTLQNNEAVLWRGDHSTLFARGYPVLLPNFHHQHALIAFGPLLDRSTLRTAWLNDVFKGTSQVAYEGVRPTQVTSKGGNYGLHFGPDTDGMLTIAGIASTFMDIGMHVERTLVFSAVLSQFSEGTLFAAASFGSGKSANNMTEARNTLMLAIESQLTNLQFDENGTVVDQTDRTTSSSANATEIDASWTVFYGVHVSALDGTMAVFTKHPGKTQLQQLVFNPGDRIFDDHWHHFAIKLGNPDHNTDNFAQLFIDGDSSIGHTLRRCLHGSTAPIGMSDNETTLLLMGHANASIFALSGFDYLLTQIEIITLGSEWMEGALSIPISQAVIFIGCGFGIAALVLAHSTWLTITEFNVNSATMQNSAKKTSHSARSSSSQANIAVRIRRVIAASNTSVSSSSGVLAQQAGRTLAMMGGLVITVLQGMNLYFNMFSWPDEFSEVYQYITFAFSIDLSMPALGIPVWVALIIQVVLAIFCIACFVWFNNREKQLFNRSLMRFRSTVIIHDELLKLQMREAAARTNQTISEELVCGVATEMVANGTFPSSDELEEDFKIHPDVAKEAVHILSFEAPSSALAGVATLFSMNRLKSKLSPAGADQFAQSILTADWVRGDWDAAAVEKKHRVQKQTIIKRSRLKSISVAAPLENNENDNDADGVPNTSFVGPSASAGTSESDLIVQVQVEEFMSAAAARHVSKADGKWLVAMLLRLAMTIDDDITTGRAGGELEQEQQENESDEELAAQAPSTAVEGNDQGDWSVRNQNSLSDATAADSSASGANPFATEGTFRRENGRKKSTRIVVPEEEEEDKNENSSGGGGAEGESPPAASTSETAAPKNAIEDKSDTDSSHDSDCSDDSDYEIDKEMDVCLGHDTDTFTVTNNKIARVIDSDTKTALTAKSIPTCLDTSDDGSCVAVVLSTSAVQLYDSRTGQVTAVALIGHPDAASIRFVRGRNDMLSTCGGAIGIRVWVADVSKALLTRLTTIIVPDTVQAVAIIAEDVPEEEQGDGQILVNSTSNLNFSMTGSATLGMSTSNLGGAGVGPQTKFKLSWTDPHSHRPRRQLRHHQVNLPYNSVVVRHRHPRNS